MKKCLLMAVALLVFCVAFFVSLRVDAAPVSLKPNQTEPQEPHWQLFLDDHVIERSTGFQRVLHHPRAHGVVLSREEQMMNHWERYGTTPMYVGWRKDGRLECYYQAHGAGSLAYAMSKDGLHWEKPNLGLVEYRGSKENNLLPCGVPRNLRQFGNVRDPDKHYALTVENRVGGKVSFCRELPDFLNDSDWQKNLTPSGGFLVSNYNGLEFWDDIHEEWVAMRQSPNHPPTRCAGRYASPDLKHWTLEHYLYPDAYDSTDPRYFHEVYGLMSLHVEGIVVGFPYWFIGDRTHPNPGLYTGPLGKKTTEEGLIGKGVSKGTMEVRLVTSRDGARTWDRTVSREAWIPHGLEQDSYNRYVRLDCQPLHKGDEDWFYGSGYNGDHCLASEYYHDNNRHRSISGLLYTQKHNRYVSLRAGNINQILITKPVKVTGKKLQLNVDANHGEVKVAIGIDKWIRHKTGQWPFKAKLPHWMILDRWGRSRLEKGFTFDDCKPVLKNSIEQDVEWKEASLESLLGKTVRLYIMVQDADLYGFRFK